MGAWVRDKACITYDLHGHQVGRVERHAGGLYFVRMVSEDRPGRFSLWTTYRPAADLTPYTPTEEDLYRWSLAELAS